LSKSKLLTVLLLLSMIVTLAVGCSQEEIGFLELQKEISELTISEGSGEMVLSLQGLPAPATADPAELILYNLLQKGITVKYNGKADLENETMDYTFSYFNETIGTELEISRFICKDNIMYIKIDTLGDFLKAIGATEASSEFDKIFGDTEYLSMTTDEYLMSMDLPEGFPFASIYQTSFMNNDLNKIVQKLMLGLPGAYQNYTAGLVVKNGNSYTWQMNGMEAVEFFGGFLKYTLENIPDFEKWLVSFINNLSEEEMALLGIEPQQKTETLMLLSMFAREIAENIAENKGAYLQAIDEGIAEILKDEQVQKTAEGIKISYTLGKNGPDSYTNNCSFDLNFYENDTQKGLQLTANAQINRTAPFALTIPTSGIMTYTEFLNKITKTMEIQIDTNSYTLTDANGVSQNYLEVKNIENQTYLPMRQIAQLLGEKVGWDAGNSRAYVERYGVQIDMTGVIIDGRTYIKTRDFTKLGYEVDWDDATRTVIITTQTL
jgi:hypothetical protein